MSTLLVAIRGTKRNVSEKKDTEDTGVGHRAGTWVRDPGPGGTLGEGSGSVEHVPVMNSRV